MSPTTKQFVWQNRDTAARDLLQLAYYAPASVRRRALQLLEAFRSAAILSELEQIVMDDERNTWERRYAIRAIASIPGDIYLPQFARFASVDGQLSFDDLIGLASQHPSNLQWVFHEGEQLAPIAYLHALQNATNYFHKGRDLNPILSQRIIEIIERDMLLLDLDLVRTLYYQDGSDATLRWLQERWDTLIYLCQVGDTSEVFNLLEGWDQLRLAVFNDCPTIIEKYNQRKQEVELLRLPFRSPFVDYQSSVVWQELNGWYQSSLEGDQQAYGKLAHVVYHERKNLSKRAVATNLLGKLKHKYDVRAPLFHALRYAPDDSQYRHLSMDASIRFEAGEALRDIPLPDVWETMVDAFFIRPRNVLEEFMSDWIAYLTDRLSGIDTPYSGMTRGAENQRFWFRDLAEINSGQNEEA